jgi:hypothetical protein
MAQHISLDKKNESKLFKTIHELAKSLFEYGEILPDFKRSVLTFNGKDFNIMKLSSEFVENPMSEVAYSVGKFTLEQELGEDQWLATDCDIEIHLKVSRNGNVAVKKCFWVV